MNTLEPFKVEYSGTNMVEASAGTGKTYNIASLYIRALIEKEINVRNILVVTYTKAATKELKNRLLNRIQESIHVLQTGTVYDKNDEFLTKLLQHVQKVPDAIVKLQKATRSFDEASIYTIHGFCQHALQEQAFESRALYDAEMIGEDDDLVLEVIDDYWRNWVAEASKSELKKPLLKLLYDEGMGPDNLAGELGTYLSKPYLKILPAKIDFSQLEEELQTLRSKFSELKQIWQDQRNEILAGLTEGQLAYYRRDWLEGWMQLMEEDLSQPMPKLKLFDKFDKFTQPVINDSLKKSSEKKGIAPPRHIFFEKAEAYFQLAEHLRSFSIQFKKNLLLSLRSKLVQKKQELEVLSYDDLLLQLRRALGDGPQGKRMAENLRNKYPIALVDEFQDTDPNQYDIFSRVYQNAPDDTALFMIGDPKQSIYSFRGADIFSYLKAKKDTDANRRFDLNHNYRSTPDLLEATNKLFGRQPNPFVFDDIPYEEVEPGREQDDYDYLHVDGERYEPIRFRHLPVAEKDQFNKKEAGPLAAEDAANEICRLINSGRRGIIKIGTNNVKPKDIAVLVRKHKQAKLMSDALQRRGIKSVRYSKESVFSTPEAGQLALFLRAVAEGGHESRIKAALAQPLSPYTAQDLLDIEEDQDRWIELLEQFGKWNEQWQQGGFAAMFRSVLKQAGIAEQLIRYDDGERRLTNIKHLGELLQEEDQKRGGAMRGLLKWFASKRVQASAREDEEQLRLESDQELVKIVTMHRSKGLEYPIVFCPFMWVGAEFSDKGKPLAYHNPENHEKTFLDLRGKTADNHKEHFWWAAREQLAETLRLAYVAITRAKQCCYISSVYASKTEFSALGYLLLGGETVLENLKTKIFTKYDAVGKEQFRQALQRQVEQNPEVFSLEKIQQEGDDILTFSGEEDPTSLKRNHFKRSTPLNVGLRISSFSSLSSWMNDAPDMPDYDQFLNESNEANERSDELSMFSFPKGPQPGTCVHNIFEEIDFKSPSQKIINQQLGRYGIAEKWNMVVYEMITRVVNKSLNQENNSLKMASLEPKNIIPEMEFYFRNGYINTSHLLSIIRPNRFQSSHHSSMAAEGFLKGYIDLTFRFGDKFYLLDYKTNYLGDKLDDYHPKQLQQEIFEASYDLQYYLYTIALHRMLKNKLPGYSYKQHFGGVFYLFVRGINHNGYEGIFFDKPTMDDIKQLNEYLGHSYE